MKTAVGKLMLRGVSRGSECGRELRTMPKRARFLRCSVACMHNHRVTMHRDLQH